MSMLSRRHVVWLAVPEFIDVPHESLVVTREMAQQNPDLVQRIVRASARGRLLLAQDPAKSTEILKKVFPNDDPQLLATSIKDMAKAYGNDKGLLNQASIDKHLKLAAGSDIVKGTAGFKEGTHWSNQFNR